MTDKVSNDAAALIGAFDVEDYVAGYEFRGDGGDYMPNDQDRSLLIDAIHGAIGEMQDSLRNAQSEAVAWTTPRMIQAMQEDDTICGTIWPAEREDVSIALYTHPAPLSEAVAVKALEWSSEPPYSVARLYPLNGFYSTEWVDAGVCELRGTFCKGDFPTVQAAKAAAQADYEQRIRSALTHPAPPLAVTDEMVERAAKAMCVQGGFDPYAIMPNDGPRWKYYVDGARAALTAALEAKQ